MKTIECNNCGTDVKVANDVANVICHECVTELVAPPPISKTTKKADGFPKGWRFYKEFVHTDGTVYHKGVEQPELKNTLPPTTVVEKPKQSKKEKAEQKQTLIEEYAALKKKLKSEKRKTVRKKIELRLSKISKLI